MVRAIDAGGIVDGVGVEPAAGAGKFDPSRLGNAEIGALAHDLAAEFPGLDPKGVVRPVAGIGVGLEARLDEGADAAEPRQIHLGLEDGPNQFVRRHLGLGNAEELLDLGRQGDRLGLAFEDTAAGGDELGVVIAPCRAGLFEQALAFAETGGGVGGGVDEDVQVIERRHQLDVLGQQHAVAEHVARHVADADHGEVLVLDVDADLAEMALDRFPGALGGDPHLLVVIARRTARREGVVQPQTELGRDLVGDIRERRRALVGGDHEVRVVAVMAHHVLGRHHLGAGEIVGDIEHAAHQGLVTVDPLRHQRLPAAFGGGPLDHEPALGADRHDDRVLDHLRLHETEDLGTEVLAAVGPANAAARHLAAAQMHPLGARRVDEDFRHRPGPGELVDLTARELEGKIGLGPATFRLLVEIGAKGGLHQIEETPEDAVLVQAGDIVQRLLEPHLQRRRAEFDVAAVGWIETDGEIFEQHPREARIVGESLFHIGLAEGNRRLTQILAVGAQHHHLAPTETGAENQPVEAVILGHAGPNAREGVLEVLLDAAGVDIDGALGDQSEIVYPDRRAVGAAVAGMMGLDLVGNLVHHPKPHILEHRQDVRKRHRMFTVIGLEAHRVFRRPGGAVEVHAEPAGRPRLLDDVDVDDRVGGAETLAVSGGEGVGIAPEKGEPPIGALTVGKGIAQVIAPGARRPDQARLDIGQLVVGDLSRNGPDDEVHAGERRVADLGVERR